MQRLGGHEDSTSMALLLSHKGAFSSRCIWHRHLAKRSKNKIKKVLRSRVCNRENAIFKAAAKDAFVLPFECFRRGFRRVLRSSKKPEITPPSMEPSNQVMCAIARSGSPTNLNQARSLSTFCCSGWLATLAPAPRIIMWSKPRSASSRPLLMNLGHGSHARGRIFWGRTPKRRRREKVARGQGRRRLVVSRLLRHQVFDRI